MCAEKLIDSQLNSSEESELIYSAFAVGLSVAKTDYSAVVTGCLFLCGLGRGLVVGLSSIHRRSHDFILQSCPVR